MKKVYAVFVFSLWFICNSCQSLTSYQLPSNTVHKISVKGNKLTSTEDLKANISGLKESNKSFMFIRLNSYLNKKRTKKDSLGIKQSSIQFFKRVPTLLDTNDITNIKNNLISYYRKNGFLKTQITSQITQDREK